MMKKLDHFNKIRISRAKKFIQSLSDFEELDFNKSFKNNRHVYHLLSAYYKPAKNISRNNLIDLPYKKYNKRLKQIPISADIP